MISRYSIAIIILLIASSTKAQNLPIIDSLKSVIKEANHDTSVCDAYLAWGEQVYLTDADTALILFQKVRNLVKERLSSNPEGALRKKYLTSLTVAFHNMAYLYRRLGEIPKSLEYFHKCLKLEEETGDDRGLTASLNQIGIIYHVQGDIAKALEYYHKSLKISEEIGNKARAGESLNNIGFIYRDQKDIEKALQYLLESLRLYEEVGDKRGIATSVSNLGIIYHEQGDISKALEFYTRSLEINQERGDKGGLASALNNIGAVHKTRGDLQNALQFFNQSLKINEELGSKRGISMVLNHIANLRYDQGKLDDALKNGTRGLLIAQEIGNPNLISVNSELLNKIAKDQGDFMEALGMYELHIKMRDSIKNEETQKASIRQQTKYEFEKAQLVKEQEEKETVRLAAEITSRRNNLQYSIILIAILVLFGGVLALGFINVSERMAEGLIFFSFLIMFEFLLVLADPSIERWSGGAPGIKLLFNAGIAALIFPAHAFFESKMKGRLVK